MEAPLVNDYKKAFICKRLLETFLGGIRILLPCSVPLYVHLLQIILFAVIPVMTGVFTLLLKNRSLKLLEATLTCGSLIILYSVIIQFLSIGIQKQNSKKGEVQEVQGFGDEEVYLFDSPFGPKTWKFLIPPKKNNINIFIHSFVAGVVAGLSVYYLSPDQIQLLKWSYDVSLIFCAIGILTMSIGIWPLFVGSPPEPAIFQQLPYDLNTFSRPSHLLTCIAIHGIASLKPYVSFLFYTNYLAHLVFVFCPILWLLGVLPPIDAYFLWVMEQYLVLFLGGSPSASNKRLICQTLFASILVLIVAGIKMFSAFAIALSIFGYILSIDIGWIFTSLKQRTRIHHSSIIPIPKSALEYKAKSTITSGKYTTERQSLGTINYIKSTIQRQVAFKEVIVLSLFLAGVVGISSSIHLPRQNWYLNVPMSQNFSTKSSPLATPVPFQSFAQNILWIILLILSLLLLIIHLLQKPFCFFVLRNPLFFLVKKSKVFGEILAFTNQLIRLGGPFLVLLLISVLIGTEARGIDMNISYLDSFFRTISYNFILRQIWQFPEQNLLILTLFYPFEKLFEEQLKIMSWLSLNIAFRIHVFTLVLLWLNGMLKRLRTIFVFSYSSIAEAKQRKIINYFIIGWNIGAFPILVILACCSSVFSFPLLPLFTLPLFLIGFPRPLRFWSYPVGYSANHCSDTIYYQQFNPYITRGLHNAVLSGKLGIVQPGDVFLLRWEDRFFWIQVLESGFVYFLYSVKGLELQETSCHTAEASRVDSIFSRAFDYTSTACGLSNFPFHCLTPLTKISAFGYSDTRNVLTGVFDSPDTLILINEYFIKSLIYILIDDAFCRDSSPVEVSSSRKASTISMDAKNRLAYSSLPKVERIPNGSSRLSVATPINDNDSIKSGRASRMAWVSESVEDMGNLKDEQKIKDNLQDRAKSTNSVNGDDDFTSSPEQNGRKLSKDRPPLSSKAKSYMTYNKDSSEPDLIKNESSFSFQDTSSDSEPESGFSKSEFFVKKNDNSHEPSEEFATPNSYWKNTVSDKAKHGRKLTKKPLYKGLLSYSLAPPHSWIMDLPFHDELVEDLQDSFPLSWFKFLLKQSALKKFQQTNNVNHKEKMIEKLLLDDALEESYRTLMALCHLVVIGTEPSTPTPSQVLKIFFGELAVSIGLDWLKKKERLFQIVLKSYRIAVKLSLDHILVGPTNNSCIDLYNALLEYNSDWYVGPDKIGTTNVKGRYTENGTNFEKAWNNAISLERPSLFSLGYDDVKGVYTSHLLTLGTAEINVGSLDRETVRAIWASLTAELLYLTNDDDERYSIQAHPIILRNLTIQAADPPLGYPIFSSSPIRMGLGWLSSL